MDTLRALLEQEKGKVTIDLKDVLIVEPISVNGSPERRRIGIRPTNEQSEARGAKVRRIASASLGCHLSTYYERRYCRQVLIAI